MIGSGRAQREVSSSRRKEQAAALQQLAELRQQKGSVRQQAEGNWDENCSAVANAQIAHGARFTLQARGSATTQASAHMRLEDSISDGEEWEEGDASALALSPKPLRRLRRLHTPAAAASAQAAAMDDLASSVASMSVASSPPRGGGGNSSTHSRGPAGRQSQLSTAAHTSLPGASRELSASPGSGVDEDTCLHSKGAAYSVRSSQPSPVTDASLPGDLVLGERSEFVLLSGVASKLYTHQVMCSALFSCSPFSCTRSTLCASGARSPCLGSLRVSSSV